MATRSKVTYRGVCRGSQVGPVGSLGTIGVKLVHGEVVNAGRADISAAPASSAGRRPRVPWGDLPFPGPTLLGGGRGVACRQGRKVAAGRGSRAGHGELAEGALEGAVSSPAGARVAGGGLRHGEKLGGQGAHVLLEQDPLRGGVYWMVLWGVCVIN